MRRHRFEAESAAVIDAALRVHSRLGPGLLESAYEACLAFELREHGFVVAARVQLPITYKGIRLDVGYRIDLLVNRSLVVELKAVNRLQPVHTAQLLSYLKLSGHRIGLLINFHELHLRDGIKRILNGY